jgi:hypothetical protein
MLCYLLIISIQLIERWVSCTVLKCYTRVRFYMNIAIIGAGIYGCHIALDLKKKGFDVDLYDMSEDIFSGASMYNSYRIHKGYHYPRSGKTRDMCKVDESEFIKCYPHLISDSKYNPKIFCVANDDMTLIDYSTMKIIMNGAGLPFEELPLDELKNKGFSNVEGGFKVYESIFLADKAKSWFRKELVDGGVNLKLNTAIDNVNLSHSKQVGISDCLYDFVINCTYNQALEYHHSKHKHFFELCFSLVVVSKKTDIKYESFGIFDGEYPSLEPLGFKTLPKKYERFSEHQLFQLFHVKHTSIGQYSDIHLARKALKSRLPLATLKKHTKSMVENTEKYYPNFCHNFDIIDYNLSLKTKVNDLNDSRPLLITNESSPHKRFIQFLLLKNK